MSQAAEELGLLPTAMNRSDSTLCQVLCCVIVIQQLMSCPWILMKPFRGCSSPLDMVLRQAFFLLLGNYHQFNLKVVTHSFLHSRAFLSHCSFCVSSSVSSTVFSAAWFYCLRPAHNLPMHFCDTLKNASYESRCELTWEQMITTQGNRKEMKLHLLVLILVNW